jgi:cardiolipin synthase
MCIIDGKVGFTGGINLADEYINQVERYGHWKGGWDSAHSPSGDAVWSMAVMFLIMWDYIRGVEDDFQKYRPATSDEQGNVGLSSLYRQPLDGEAVGEDGLSQSDQ